MQRVNEDSPLTPTSPAGKPSGGDPEGRAKTSPLSFTQASLDSSPVQGSQVLPGPLEHGRTVVCTEAGQQDWQTSSWKTTLHHLLVVRLWAPARPLRASAPCPVKVGLVFCPRASED